MQLTLEEIVMIAVENQHIILEQELKKGVPLNYLDDNGQYDIQDEQVVVVFLSHCHAGKPAGH